MSKVIVGRHVNGITLNGLEWLLDDEGCVKIFDSEDDAKGFLRSEMVTDEEMEWFVFRHSIGACSRCGSPLFPSQIEGYTSQCFSCDEDFFSFEQSLDAIIIELDYKGCYSRFALSAEEFKREYPETHNRIGIATEEGTDTIKPMVHIWFKPCKVGDDDWKRHFTDMGFGLSEIDIETGNLAYVDLEKMGDLKKYIVVE